MNELAGSGACENTKRQSEVGTEFEVQSKLLTELESAIDILSGKIASVMRPSEPYGEDCEKDSGPSTEVGRAIRKASERIGDCIRTVNNVSQRIEL